MTPSKLSDSEKHAAARLYREPGETTSTLAERYGVSSTTIRRALKSSLSQKEYETLTNQKQVARWQGVDPPKEPEPLHDQQKPSHNVDTFHPSTPQEPAAQQELNLGQPLSTGPKRRLRKRLSTPTSASDGRPIDDTDDTALRTNSSTDLEEALHVESEALNNFDSVQVYGSVESVEDKEFLEELDEELDAGLEELDDEDFEDDLEPLPSAVDEKTAYTASRLRPEVLINVLPLSEASIPRTCYLVVDRSAELIARPLKEFCDLGQVPIKEVQEKTLPVFDNHRVARRFSNRSQRVIKIPDGGMLQKACSQLHAKGITRLLINGRVYSL
jgi:transposase-like protein